MERTQRDTDIARMSALKAAVELTTTFHNIDSTGEKASDAAIAIAEKFLAWIQGGSQPQEESEDNWFELVCKDIHRLQDKLGLQKTDFQNERPQLFESWREGGAQNLLEQLRIRAKNGSKAGSFAGDVDKDGWEKRSIYEGGLRDGEYPITKKQYGFLVGLHRKLGKEPDKDALNSLSTREASSLIDHLQEQVGTNGNGGQPPR